MELREELRLLTMILRAVGFDNMDGRQVHLLLHSYKLAMEKGEDANLIDITKLIVEADRWWNDEELGNHG